MRDPVVGAFHTVRDRYCRMFGSTTRDALLHLPSTGGHQESVTARAPVPDCRCDVQDPAGRVTGVGVDGVGDQGGGRHAPPPAPFLATAGRVLMRLPPGPQLGRESGPSNHVRLRALHGTFVGVLGWPQPPRTFVTQAVHPLPPELLIQRRLKAMIDRSFSVESNFRDPWIEVYSIPQETGIETHGHRLALSTVPALFLETPCERGLIGLYLTGIVTGQ